MQAM
jgi:mitogen-activated protein kinase 1/3